MTAATVREVTGVDTDPLRVEPGRAPDLGGFPTRPDPPFGKAEGRRRLRRAGRLLADLQERLWAERRRSLLVVLQGMDTSGKDGVIRRVFRHGSPLGMRAEAFGVPTATEAAHDFLWRIHRRAPAAGEIVIFNRSHYEDVVAVRVRRLAPPEVWSGRPERIREFEALLGESGTRVVKLFLHISPAEQAERLRARLTEPAKRWKFNPADLEDRARWGEFMDAWDDVMARTSVPTAPWWVIPADRKWWRDLAAATVIVGALEEIDPRPPVVDLDPDEHPIR